MEILSDQWAVMALSQFICSYYLLTLRRWETLAFLKTVLILVCQHCAGTEARFSSHNSEIFSHNYETRCLIFFFYFYPVNAMRFANLLPYLKKCSVALKKTK